MSMHDRFTAENRGDEDHEDRLRRDLHAIRPRPREDFRQRLDSRVAEGFAPRRRDRSGGAEGTAAPGEPAGTTRGLRQRLGLPASSRLGPVLAGVAATFAVAAAVVVTEPDLFESNGSETALQHATSTGQAESRGAEAEAVDPGSALDAGPEAAMTSPAPAMPGGLNDSFAADRDRRAVERGASLTLATEPEAVADVSAGVLRVAAHHDGIVLSSATRTGSAGAAGAEFHLKLPSSNLGPALNDLSELALLRDRRENTLDITAPTVSAADRLREARAEVRGLLKQLAEAGTDSEREAIRVDLRPAQQRVAGLRSQLERLERRASFADVRVSILSGETGVLPNEEEGTIGGAVEDALRILTGLAGILIVAAAILVPIALLALSAWAFAHVWRRRSREHALRQDRPAGNEVSPPDPKAETASGDQPS